MNENRVNLGDLAASGRSVISGPFGSNIGKRFFKSTGIPIIRGNNLTTDSTKFKDDGFVFLTKEKADELKSDALEGDILFTAAGTIGQIGMIPTNAKYDRYVISNKQLRLRLNTEKVNKDYVYYWLTSPWIYKTILNRNTGSTVPLINLTVIKSLPVNLPESIQAQKKIAKVLSDIDAKIELNNKINTELESMAKLIYDYWFVQFDFPDANGKPYKSSGGKMVFNEELKREIPEGWNSGNIMSLTNLIGGGTPKTKVESYWRGEIPFFTPADAEDVFSLTTKESITQEGLDSCSSKLFDQGTIFITARGTVGKINIASQQMAMNQSCYALQGKENVDSAFVYFYAKELVQYIKSKASGSIFKALVTNDFKFTALPVPPISIIKEFSVIVTSSFDKILTSKKENQKLAELRDWLLPMLMNGQVTVK